MKPDIHPETFIANVHCACGETWQVRSTREDIRVDVCSDCHPFFTGEQRIVDTAGRVERFRRRYAKAEQPDAGEQSGTEQAEQAPASE